MTWASRRQGWYLLGTVVALGVLIGVPLFFYFYEEPTCRDGIQNGMEEGIDCGGPCSLVCDFQAVAPIVHWSQEFMIVPGVYSVVAFVENANDVFQSEKVPYVFRLYDSKNVLVAERFGSADIPPHTILPVFETGIQTGERIPARVAFSFEEDVEWVRSSFEIPDIDVVSRRFDTESSAPRLLVTLRNNTLDSFLRVPVVVVLYDASDNAIHASRTVVSNIGGTSDVDIVFTWPQQFTSSVARIEVTPLFSLPQ